MCISRHLRSLSTPLLVERNCHTQPVKYLRHVVDGLVHPDGPACSHASGH